jgi:hypothetical protein
MAYREIRLGDNLVRIWDEDRYLETHLPGGGVVPAAANHDPESLALAHSLGYHGDTWAMSRDHEVIHTLIAVRRGLACSPTLLYVATEAGPGMDEGLRCREEQEVLGLQASLRCGAPALFYAREDWPALVTEAGTLLYGDASRAALPEKHGVLDLGVVHCDDR